MYMLCKRKEEFEGKYMGFIFILSIILFYYSILLFFPSPTRINFSLFFFPLANTTRCGPILPGRVFFGGDSLLRPP